MTESFLDKPEKWLSAEDWSRAVQELKDTDSQRRRTKEVLEYSLKKVKEMKVWKPPGECMNTNKEENAKMRQKIKVYSDGRGGIYQTVEEK